MLRRALAHFEQPVAAEPAPGSPAAAAGLPSLPARIGSTLAYGLLVAAYWTAAARAVALCNPLAAMRSGTVAALVFDIGQLPHTLVLLLSLDHWAWHALNALAVAKKGMLGLSAFAGRGLSSGAVSTLRAPSASLRPRLSRVRLWAQAQFPAQAWMHAGIASMSNQAESDVLSQALLHVLSPLMVALVLVCSLASALACLALRPLSFSLTIICGVRYCGPACQAADWARHRSKCSGGAEQEILNMARA
ncbi:hypothetical protein ABPG77_011056 [Micractinium sp. CCAP 211/92]